MSTKSETYRLRIELVSKIEDLVKSGKYGSKTFVIEKALKQFFDSLEKKEEEKPLTVEFMPEKTKELELQLQEKDLKIQELEKKISDLSKTSTDQNESYTVPLAETELADQILEWEQEGIFKVEWCNYGTIIKEGERLYKIHCSNPKTPKTWLPKDRLIDVVICRNCGLRREGAREQRKRQIQEKNEQPSRKPKIPPPWDYTKKMMAIGLQTITEKKSREQEILGKKRALEEEDKFKREHRYAITHQYYEKNCVGCQFCKGYFSDSEKRFGTVECISEQCIKGTR